MAIARPGGFSRAVGIGTVEAFKSLMKGVLHVMTTSVEPQTWRRYGFGGPPEEWPHDAQRDLDRLATSYYIDVLEFRRRAVVVDPPPPPEVEELFTLATRHKQEIDYTLRHSVTPAEQARVEDRLGALMRISRRLRDIVEV